MIGKLISNRWGLLAGGIVVMIIGIVMLMQTDVKCGGRQMHPGDRCKVDGGRILTYSQQKAEDSEKGYFMLVFGGALLVGSAAGFTLRSRAGSARPAR